MTYLVLVYRNHVSDRSSGNNWNSLSRYLNRKIYTMSLQKAQIEIRKKDKVYELGHKIIQYNNKYNTDFVVAELDEVRK